MGVSVRTSRVVSCLDVVLCTCPESKRSDLGVLLRVYHAFRGLLANVVCHIRSSHIGSRGGGASLVALGGGLFTKEHSYVLEGELCGRSMGVDSSSRRAAGRARARLVVPPAT